MCELSTYQVPQVFKKTDFFFFLIAVSCQLLLRWATSVPTAYLHAGRLSGMSLGEPCVNVFTMIVIS